MAMDLLQDRFQNKFFRVYEAIYKYNLRIMNCMNNKKSIIC